MTNLFHKLNNTLNRIDDRSPCLGLIVGVTLILFAVITMVFILKLLSIVLGGPVSVLLLLIICMVSIMVSITSYQLYKNWPGE